MLGLVGSSVSFETSPHSGLADFEASCKRRVPREVRTTPGDAIMLAVGLKRLFDGQQPLVQMGWDQQPPEASWSRCDITMLFRSLSSTSNFVRRMAMRHVKEKTTSFRRDATKNYAKCIAA